MQLIVACRYPGCGAAVGEACRGTFTFGGRPMVHLIRVADIFAAERRKGDGPCN